MHQAKTANLLGALSVTLSDRMDAAANRALGIGGFASAILVLVDAQPGILIEAMARHFGRAQSGIVHAVGRLERRGLVEKRTGRDRRTLEIHATAAGRAMVASLLSARATVLSRALSAVPEPRRQDLADLVSAMLEALVVEEDDRFAMCRLCDVESCGEVLDCPVERGSARCRRAAGQQA